MLELKNISIALNGRRLVGDFSLTVAQGKIVTFKGASGSGKSSLLGHIAGFLRPPFACTGDVILDGRVLNELPSHHREIGILFQDALLFPHLSVRDNLTFALPRGLSRQMHRQEIAQALRDCGMSEFIDADPASLSGGQKARIALMRSLLARPKALLLDEPFSKLDPDLRGTFRQFVFEHIRDKQLPAILVTHDDADAKAAQGKMFTLPL